METMDRFTIDMGDPLVLDPIVLRDGQCDSTLAYSGDEALTGEVYGGPGAPVEFNPVAEWVDPANAVIRLALDGADTALLDPGSWQARVRLTGPDGSQTTVYRAVVQVVEGPVPLGTDPPPRTEVSYQDLLLYARGDLEPLAVRGDQAGFKRQRVRATSWLYGILHQHWRGRGLYPGYGYGFVYGVGPGTGARDPYLESLLQDGRLEVSDEVREVIARKAIAYVFDTQLSMTGDKPSQYTGLAAKFHSRADAMATQLTCGVDWDGDGVSDVWISMTGSVPL